MHIQFLILLQCFCFSMIAQGVYNTAEDSDPQATRILQGLKKQVHEAQSLSLNFSFNIDYPGREAFLTEGNIIQKGDLIKVDSDQQTSFTNQNGQWIYLKGINEVEINDLDENGSDIFLNPIKIVEFYESNDFVYAISEQNILKDKTIYDIEFKPLIEESEYSKMRIRISEEKDFILENVKIFMKDGTRMDLQIEKFNYNQLLDDNIFYFDASNYPDVQIEDLRF